jgi:hypothetical protein
MRSRDSGEMNGRRLSIVIGSSRFASSMPLSFHRRSFDWVGAEAARLDSNYAACRSASIPRIQLSTGFQRLNAGPPSLTTFDLGAVPVMRARGCGLPPQGAGGDPGQVHQPSLTHRRDDA